MKKQIFRAILSVALSVLLASLVLIVGVLHGYFQDRVLEELSQSTAYVARAVENEGIAYLESGAFRDSRITWVDRDGTVLYDNREDPAAMENHAGREEIREAMLLGHGTAVRQSATLAQKTVYYALRLQDGSVLRLAGRLSNRLVAPINAIDLAAPGEELDYEELAPLVGRIRSQNREISRRMEELRRQQEEFRAITEHMSEGLLVIDRETRVLSHNGAALRLLGATEPAEEASVLTLNRESGFRRCVEEALAGRRCEELLERGDTCCRVFANPVEQDGERAGAVLILLDVTEKERRETLRREFTANVSHELKTPLTSILGTAEILENGLVKTEDVSHFAGNIHREAQRLIGLVNDIIKLSRLDEGGPAGQWGTVSLRGVAEGVLDQLTLAAERKQVTLSLEGDCGPVRGVPQIVEEIIYNLCDNAVAYNKPGGSVTVTLSACEEGERVTVADTGIGIPPEDRARVFERFYRVDKSHSGGGTGLGLSIVKHGAAYLGARVELESEPGRGCTFTLIFPKHT